MARKGETLTQHRSHWDDIGSMPCDCWVGSLPETVPQLPNNAGPPCETVTQHWNSTWLMLSLVVYWAGSWQRVWEDCIQNTNIPANTTHWPGIDLTLGHCLRRWPNVKSAPGQCVVFAGRGLSLEMCPDQRLPDPFSTLKGNSDGTQIVFGSEISLQGVQLGRWLSQIILAIKAPYWKALLYHVYFQHSHINLAASSRSLHCFNEGGGEIKCVRLHAQFLRCAFNAINIIIYFMVISD